MLARTALIAFLCGFVAVPAIAKEYYAERFDSRIEVRPDGSLLVRETIVFRFESGTFTFVFRTVPTRRTDGVEFVQASMDGHVLPRGDGAGSVEVRRKNGLRVDWHFAPVSNGAHTFELVYLARGVVRQEPGEDLLEWRALPGEHAYRIEESAVTFHVPASVEGTVALDSRRVDGEASVATADGLITVRATDIRRNGWIEPRIAFASGTLIASPPAWQQRRARQFALAPTWTAIAGGVILIGFVLLIVMRQSYDSPPPSSGVTWSSVIPPDTLPPALAGALVTNGQPNLGHAMATLVSLAERGILSIRESRAAFGQRSFTIRRERQATGLAPHESALLETIFRKAGHDHAVPLSKTRSHLAHRFGPFRDAVNGELRDHGLLDDQRRRHRSRYYWLGLILLIAAALTIIPTAMFRDAYGPWPLLIMGALAVVSVGSFIFGGAETPLSNEGVRRADAWRGYKSHVKDPQEIEPRWGASAAAETRILPFIVALGVAGAWSKFMKKRNAITPPWFEPVSDLDQGRAFAAFVAYGGADASGGGAYAGGGAAGGGASGAG